MGLLVKIDAQFFKMNPLYPPDKKANLLSSIF